MSCRSAIASNCRARPRPRIRSDLIEREKQIDRKAAKDGVLQEAKRTLRQERERVKHWKLSADGFRAIAPGLKDSVRRARSGMVAAWLHPTAAHHHSWRRHVKNHWFHVRLLEARCGNHLQPYQRQLEALDGVLGEYHNLVLLHEVLVSDSTLSRKEVARCLRIVERYQQALRRQRAGARHAHLQRETRVASCGASSISGMPHDAADEPVALAAPVLEDRGGRAGRDAPRERRRSARALAAEGGARLRDRIEAAVAAVMAIAVVGA